LPVQVGFVNSLQFSNDGSLLVAGVGSEHRLGRWWHLKSAKNCVCVIRLKKLSTAKKSGTFLWSMFWFADGVGALSSQMMVCC